MITGEIFALMVVLCLAIAWTFVPCEREEVTNQMRCRPALGLAIAFLVSVSSSALGDCNCRHVQNGETTHWGGNREIEIEQKNPIKVLRGVVKSSEEPLQGALVEVFRNTEHPSRARSNGIQEQPKQSRVAACRTRADGNFCFRHLAPGNYELRSSIDSGWDVTIVKVAVDEKAGKEELINVSMYVGN